MGKELTLDAMNKKRIAGFTQFERINVPINKRGTPELSLPKDIYEDIDRVVYEYKEYQFNDMCVCLNPSIAIEYKGKVFSYVITYCEYKERFYTGYECKKRGTSTGDGGRTAGASFRIDKGFETLDEALLFTAFDIRCFFYGFMKKHKEFEQLENFIINLNNKNMAAPKKYAEKKNLDKNKVEALDNSSYIPEIDLDKIIADPNQPRKFFKEEEVIELSESIIKHGVNSPILVRPIPHPLPHSTGGEGGVPVYMIVFGERRYRASLMARKSVPEITTIPAMVKDMSDDEALELQLTENLQRHNPHPMEEAISIQRMLEKHDLDEVVARLNKSKKYVAQRLLLNNLLRDFQDVFFMGKCDTKSAIMLAKLPIDTQQEIFNDHVGESWQEDEDFILEDIEYLMRGQNHNLDQAPFKTEDATLFPSMGACGKCSFNSSNNLLLFMDTPGRICNNSVCYNLKCERSYKQKIEDALMDPQVVFITTSYYLSNEEKKKMKAVKDAGGVLLNAGTFQFLNTDGPGELENYIDEHIGSDKPEWEDFYAERKDEVDGWEKNKKKFEKDCKEEFAESEAEWEKDRDEISTNWQLEVKKWEEELVQYAYMRKDGKIKKAFVVTSNDAGNIVEIIPNANEENDVDTGSNANEVNDLISREQRAQQLDAEKIWEEIRKLMPEDCEMRGNNKPYFGENDLEYMAMGVVVYNSLSYGSKEFFCEQVLKKNEHDMDVWEFAKLFIDLLPGHRRILDRLLLRDKLFTFGSDADSNIMNYWGRMIAMYYKSEQVKVIEAKQLEIARVRGEKVAKRIADLNNKKK